MKHDRQLLLAGVKRNEILTLEEVERYGVDSYGDANYVSIYGLRPGEWYGKGIRLLGRTAVECTRDDLGSSIAEHIAAIVATAPIRSGVLVVDPFAGSGNTLYWILRQLPGARGVGFELDDGVFPLTQANLSRLALPIQIEHTDYLQGLNGLVADEGGLVVIFVAPPWGKALAPVTGLDLRQTEPPISQVVARFIDHFPCAALLFAVQIHETVDQHSLTELTPTFDWSTLVIYQLNASGQNHGLLLCTKGWQPRANSPTSDAA